MVISASLQACGVVFPFAISTSICRSKFTICSGLYLFIGMTGLPPGEFSLISPGTKIPSQVKVLERDGWRCQSCGRMEDLQVHHIQRRSQLGDDTAENLV